MFTKMRMKNFKSWIDTGEVRLAPITGFFGANSSGKSSLLQMLLLLKQTTESNDRKLVLKTGSLQEGYVNLGTVHEITYGDTTDLSFMVGWDLPEPLQIRQSRKGRPSLTIRSLTFAAEIYASTQDIYVKNFEYEAPGFSAGMARQDSERYGIQVRLVDQEPQRPRSRPRIHMKPQKTYSFSDEALLYYQNTDYLSDIVLAFEQQFSRLYYLGPLREYPQRIYTWAGERPTDVGLKGELAVPALLAGKNERVYSGKSKRTQLERRIAEWFVEMGLAHAFAAKPLVEGGMQYEVRLKKTASSPEVLITDLGFGVSQVLPVLVLCYYAPPRSTLIFEQPELHLHPAVQSGLADVFIDVAKHRSIQIIVESHSEHLLRRLQRRVAEEKLSPDNVALYFCDVNDQGSHISKLDLDLFGNIRNWPQDFFGDLTGDLYEMAQSGIKRQLNGKHQTQDP